MTPLLTLLEVIKRPDDPSFASALAQLAHVAPEGLSTAELTSLLAALDSATVALQQQQATTSRELADLRGKLQAKLAYGGGK